VAVVGDGAVSLYGVLAASLLGAERVITTSRHEPRQRLAREFGATDLVTECGDEGIARIIKLTEGVGADAVLECVGTGESMLQALRSTRSGAWWATSASRTAWNSRCGTRPACFCHPRMPQCPA
jgi:threonine dehydrogenase-like Zn-dependent dehydrogenase